MTESELDRWAPESVQTSCPRYKIGAREMELLLLYGNMKIPQNKWHLPALIVNDVVATESHFC